MSDEDWDAVLAVNLKGAFLLTRAVAPLMMEAGSGAIVSIASVVGIEGNIWRIRMASSASILLNC
jgi:3-oxoacyl-[acyl-carrier protein] reductase